VSASGLRRPRVLACCGGMVIVSGLERMTFETLRVLSQRGAAVHCVLNSWSHARIRPLVEAVGASWSEGRYRVPFDRHTRHPLHWARLAWDIAATSLGLLRDAWRFRPSHVLVPELAVVLRNAPALALLRATGVRVVFRLDNAPVPWPFYGRLWRRAVNPLVDRFVANSRFTLEALLAHGIAPAKVSLIYNCPPTRAQQPEAPAVRDDGRVIYIGQVIPGKRLDLLLEAIGLLAARGQDVRLDVVGEMGGWEPPAWRGYQERVLARARRPDLDGHVRFLGDREDVSALLASGGVHCCPSHPELRESFGVVIVEAKEAGVPSVVCASGALPELVSHGVDGWVCGADTPEALAEGLGYFLEDPGRARKAGAAARASLERFSRARFASAWWNLIREGT
jgi:glycosyltransferase involved in cell wall biosynthesis